MVMAQKISPTFSNELLDRTARQVHVHCVFFASRYIVFAEICPEQYLGISHVITHMIFYLM
jgi:hypothetical protein